MGKVPGAVVNRSPVVNNHYYTQAQPTPPVAAPIIIEPPAPREPTPAPQPTTGRRRSRLWWLAIPLLLGLAVLAWYLLAPADDDNTDPTCGVDRGTRIEILMNLINSNTYVILPFGQLAALIGLTWLAFVAYQCVRGILYGMGGARGKWRGQS